MEMVCCSIASWMATWSFTSILSNSSMQQMPLSASIRAPASIANSLFSGSCRGEGRTKEVNELGQPGGRGEGEGEEKGERGRGGGE